MNKLTKKQSHVLKTINDLIVKNDDCEKTKAALYAASEAFLNRLK